jgi:hypothetical protein
VGHADVVASTCADAAVQSVPPAEGPPSRASSSSSPRGTERTTTYRQTDPLCGHCTEPADTRVVTVAGAMEGPQDAPVAERRGMQVEGARGVENDQDSRLGVTPAADALIAAIMHSASHSSSEAARPTVVDSVRRIWAQLTDAERAAVVTEGSDSLDEVENKEHVGTKRKISALEDPLDHASSGDASPHSILHPPGPGDTVWAKQRGYAWWPAMVRADSATGEPKVRSRNDTTGEGCVQFFGFAAPPSAWVRFELLLPYRGPDDRHGKVTLSRQRRQNMSPEEWKASWKLALEEIAAAHQLASGKERLDKYDVAENTEESVPTSPTCSGDRDNVPASPVLADTTSKSDPASARPYRTDVSPSMFDPVKFSKIKPRRKYEELVDVDPRAVQIAQAHGISRTDTLRFHDEEWATPQIVAQVLNIVRLKHRVGHVVGVGVIRSRHNPAFVEGTESYLAYAKKGLQTDTVLGVYGGVVRCACDLHETKQPDELIGKTIDISVSRDWTEREALVVDGNTTCNELAMCNDYRTNIRRYDDVTCQERVPNAVMVEATLPCYDVPCILLVTTAPLSQNDEILIDCKS